MARYSDRSPSHERAGEEEGDHHTLVISSPAPTCQPHQGQEFMSPPTPRPITSPRFTEQTPLLPHSPFQTIHYRPHKWVARAKSITAGALRALPAVTLGLLLNILDGISCTLFIQSVGPRFYVILDGMIIFPASGVFMDLGTMGVSMFFVSYVFYLLELAFTFDNSVVL